MRKGDRLWQVGFGGGETANPPRICSAWVLLVGSAASVLCQGRTKTQAADSLSGLDVYVSMRIPSVNWT